MPGSRTPQDQLWTRDLAPIVVLPSAMLTESASWITTSFVAQWLTYTLPCQRFDGHLAVHDA
jgi:hypothetical protein